MVDTTLVSALHCDGTARRGGAHNEGVATSMAECRKERISQNLYRCVLTRSRLVVLAVGVGGRWSYNDTHFINALARARARCEGLLLRRRAEQAAARAVADTFSELPGSVGADGDTPASHEGRARLRVCGVGVVKQ